MRQKFKPEVCECCGQSMTYQLGLDKGSAKIILAILEAVIKKGINEIHPANELDISGKKKWYPSNLSRPRFHGLIAHVKNKKGYYCLTRKAGQFLRGEPIPRYALISKVTGHQEGYINEAEDQVTLRQLLKEPTMWSGDAERMINKIYEPEATSTLF